MKVLVFALLMVLLAVPALTATQADLLNSAAASDDRTATGEFLKNFECPSEDGAHAIPGRCDAFIYCKNGQFLSFLCGEGSSFNPALGDCDYGQNGKCYT